MIVIQFPRSEDSRLGEALSRASEQLAEEVPPQWVHLQLRAHLARQAGAPQRISVPMVVGAALTRPAGLAMGAAGGTVGTENHSNQSGNGPIDYKSWAVVFAVLLGALALLIGTGRWPPQGATDSTVSSPLVSTSKLASPAVEDEFIPVASPQRWRQIVPQQSRAKYDRSAAQAWVVAAELPAEQLARFGLPFDPARAAEPVRAELLLHSSGEVLAVRFDR